MDVFIGNLPASISFNEIRKLHGNWNFDVAVERVDGQDRHGNEFHYFLAHFPPQAEAEAERLIREMSGISCYGNLLDVREFIHRSYSNERRALDWREKRWDQPERRIAERRKGSRH